MKIHGNPWRFHQNKSIQIPVFVCFRPCDSHEIPTEVRFLMGIPVHTSWMIDHLWVFSSGPCQSPDFAPFGGPKTMIQHRSPMMINDDE